MWKLELFKGSVLLVITGKPQTLAQEGRIFIRFSTCLSAAALSHM